MGSQMKKTVDALEMLGGVYGVSELKNGNVLFRVSSLDDLVPILRAIDPRYGGEGKIEVSGTDVEETPAVFEISGDDDAISGKLIEIFYSQKVTANPEWIDGELLIAGASAAKITKTPTDFKLEFLGTELFFSERSYARIAADLIFEISENKARLAWVGDELKIAQTGLVVANIVGAGKGCNSCECDCQQFDVIVNGRMTATTFSRNSAILAAEKVLKLRRSFV